MAEPNQKCEVAFFHTPSGAPCSSPASASRPRSRTSDRPGDQGRGTARGKKVVMSCVAICYIFFCFSSREKINKTVDREWRESETLRRHRPEARPHIRATHLHTTLPFGERSRSRYAHCAEVRPGPARPGQPAASRASDRARGRIGKRVLEGLVWAGGRPWSSFTPLTAGRAGRTVPRAAARLRQDPAHWRPTRGAGRRAHTQQGRRKARTFERAQFF